MFVCLRVVANVLFPPTQTRSRGVNATCVSCQFQIIIHVAYTVAAVSYSMTTYLSTNRYEIGDIARAAENKKYLKDFSLKSRKYYRKSTPITITL